MGRHAGTREVWVPSQPMPAGRFTTGLRGAYTAPLGKGGVYAGMAFAQQGFLVAGGAMLPVDKLPSWCGRGLAPSSEAMPAAVLHSVESETPARSLCARAFGKEQELWERLFLAVERS